MLLKVLVAFILLAHLSDAALKLNLKKHELEGRKLLKQGKFAEYHALKTQRHAQKIRAGRLSTGKSRLSDLYDSLYSVEVSFGTPPQKFRLFPDVTSTVTWVTDISIDGNRTTGDLYCKIDPCFKSSASSTYIKDGRTFRYDYSSDLGFYGIDTVGLGELTISNVTFVQSYGEFYMGSVPLDGTLGLGLPSISNDSVESVFSTAVREKVVNKSIFTIWIDGSASENKSHGQITWGDVDLEHCSSDITYIPLIDQTNYVFNLDGYSVNDGKKVAANWKAASDPNTRFIYVPTQPLQDLIKVVNASYDFTYRLYAVDCDVKFNWTFYAGDKALTVDEKVGVASFTDDESIKCYLGIEALTYSDNEVLLGSSFLNEWCTTYDISGKGQIGYAKSK